MNRAIYLYKLLFLAGACIFIAGCATKKTVSEGGYQLADRSHLFHLDSWQFRGRLAMLGEEPWSASIAWSHTPGRDELKLAGPLGQGAARISLAGNTIIIDRGDGKPMSSNNPQALVNNQLGLPVPIEALRYWVVGVNQPGESFLELKDGFIQDGWSVQYPEFIEVRTESMPRKVFAMKKNIKLKLVIDYWELNGETD